MTHPTRLAASAGSGLGAWPALWRAVPTWGFSSMAASEQRDPLVVTNSPASVSKEVGRSCMAFHDLALEIR